MLLPPVHSFAELRVLAMSDPSYKRLATITVEFLFGDTVDDFEMAVSRLMRLATPANGGEDSIIEEVNFCRDYLAHLDAESGGTPQKGLTLLN